MSGLVAPLPRNARIAGANPDALKIVEGDVYNVAERVRELSPNLRIVLHPGHAEPFVVMEDCADGECRFVSRYAELDARIVEDLARMRAIPFAERFARRAAEIDAHNAALERARLDSEEFDEFVWHFRNDLKALAR